MMVSGTTTSAIGIARRGASRPRTVDRRMLSRATSPVLSFRVDAHVASAPDDISLGRATPRACIVPRSLPPPAWWCSPRAFLRVRPSASEASHVVALVAPHARQPTSCIATQALARSVEERLGRHVFVSAAEADVSVEGRIEKRSAGGWHSVITIRDGKGALLGTRELDRPDASCDAMNEPLALVIAVMIDPEAKLSSASSPPPLPPPTPAPAPAPAPAPVRRPHTDVPTDLDPRRDRKRASPGASRAMRSATVTTGLAPTVDRRRRASPGRSSYREASRSGFVATASLFLPTKAEQDGARASFDLFYLGSAICPTMRRPAVTLMLCFGGHLGVLRSHPETQGRNIEDKTEVIWNAVSEGRITRAALRAARAHRRHLRGAAAPSTHVRVHAVERGEHAREPAQGLVVRDGCRCGNRLLFPLSALIIRAGWPHSGLWAWPPSRCSLRTRSLGGSFRR